MFKQNKILSFLVLFSFALTAHAQHDSPFDTASVARGLSKVTTLKDDMTKLNAPSRCQPFNKNDPNTMVACSSPDEDVDNSVITKVEFEPGKIDPRLNDVIPEEFRKDTKDKKTACIIRFKMMNDNKEMIGMNQEQGSGDDVGRTHSLGLSVSCSSEDGLSKTFSYDSELYTNPEMANGKFVRDSENRVKQKFVSETVFAFVQDNINQGKATYWKRGFGFINKTDKKTFGPLSSANQQEWFHATLNKISGEGSAVTYNYEQGSMNKWGAFVTMSVGLQEHANLGNRCRVSLAAETGFRAGTIKDSSYWNASANAQFSYDITKGNAIYLRGRYDATDRPGSSFVREQSVALGLQRIKSGTYLEVGTMKQQGNRTDVHDIPNVHTGKNDSMIFLRLGYGF